MPTFRIAFSPDLLGANGRPIFPAAPLRQLDDVPGLHYKFLEKPPAIPGMGESAKATITPAQIQDIHALVLGGSRITAATFAAGTDALTFICRFAVGYDDLDLAAFTQAGVVASNIRGATSHHVASAALLMILALSKRLADKQRLAHSGRWDQIRSVLGNEIEHKTLGIIGLGATGQEVVRLIAPFDMQVIAYSPHADPAVAQNLGVSLVSLDGLLTRADFVSIHCNLTPATTKLIGARELRLMKPSAYLINLARGKVVDQQALTQALAEHWIAGAGLDAFEVEPLPADDPLTRLDNVILTPHCLGVTQESGEAATQMVVNLLLQVARGEAPRNLLNPAVLDSQPFQQKLARWRQTPAAGATLSEELL